jgi:hypothetical protein
MGMEWYPWGHPLMCLGTIEVVRWYRFYEVSLDAK